MQKETNLRCFAQCTCCDCVKCLCIWLAQSGECRLLNKCGGIWNGARSRNSTCSQSSSSNCSVKTMANVHRKLYHCFHPSNDLVWGFPRGFWQKVFYCLFVVSFLHGKKKIQLKQQMQLAGFFLEDPTSAALSWCAGGTLGCSLIWYVWMNPCDECWKKEGRKNEIQVQDWKVRN